MKGFSLKMLRNSEHTFYPPPITPPLKSSHFRGNVEEYGNARRATDENKIGSSRKFAICTQHN